VFPFHRWSLFLILAPTLSAAGSFPLQYTANGNRTRLRYVAMVATIPAAHPRVRTAVHSVDSGMVRFSAKCPKRAVPAFSGEPENPPSEE
jgi:hypothetical protein